MINDDDLKHLRRCVVLARTALEAGDEPFGSLLVSGDGTVLFEDRNRVSAATRRGIPNLPSRNGRRTT